MCIKCNQVMSDKRQFENLILLLVRRKFDYTQLNHSEYLFLCRYIIRDILFIKQIKQIKQMFPDTLRLPKIYLIHGDLSPDEINSFILLLKQSYCFFCSKFFKIHFINFLA